MASKALCVIPPTRIDCSLLHCKKKSQQLAVQVRYHQGKLSTFSDLVWKGPRLPRGHQRITPF